MLSVLEDLRFYEPFVSPHTSGTCGNNLPFVVCIVKLLKKNSFFLGQARKVIDSCPVGADEDRYKDIKLRMETDK